MKPKAPGDIGENEVVSLIPCPNCGKKLIQLPKNYPLYDIQCTGCSFRAQVKTNNSKPKNEIFGAGWEIMDKVLKSGFMVPALIVNYKWVENGISHQKILFYPFVPKTHLKKRQLSSRARRANYKMFNYIKMNRLPHLVLFEK
jgi:DNA-directed RNA polymerase subunit RPC12/RpoP